MPYSVVAYDREQRQILTLSWATYCLFLGIHVRVVSERLGSYPLFPIGVTPKTVIFTSLYPIPMFITFVLETTDAVGRAHVRDLY